MRFLVVGLIVIMCSGCGTIINGRWRYDKPVLITEMVLKSSRGTWIKPYDYREERVLSLDHQSRAYEAMFSALSDRPWLKGIYWWKWPTQLDRGGPKNDDFTPNGKPAEQVVAKWYMGYSH